MHRLTTRLLSTLEISMLAIISFLLLASLEVSEAFNYTSSLVFDPLFYVNNYEDLKRSGIHTVEKARNHWLNTGIDQGRQGIGSFHSKQYLARYKDLQDTFGHNYRQAIEHFLGPGRTEDRKGYKEGGFEGRWTVSAGGIYVSASSRMGGAIDSITMNNREIVNNHDHGRQLQMACNSNPYTECYNPTEAGGRDDGYHSTTHTHIDWVRAGSHVLESQVHPSFWLRPGSHETQGSSNNACGAGKPALNHQVTYAYPFHKKVTIGTHSISNCIEYISNFTLGGDWPDDLHFIQMESPTGYMAWDFDQFYNFNFATRQEEKYLSHHTPIIMATADHQNAVGIYSPDGQDSLMTRNYLMNSFRLRGFDNATNKWDVVFYKKRFQGSGPITQVYKTYICIGSMDMVKTCLHSIMLKIPHL